MTKTPYYTICLLFLLLSASCSDFLKEESQDELIVRTARDFGELLLGEGYPSVDDQIYACMNVLSDDAEIDASQLTDKDELVLVANFACFTWQPDMWDKLSRMRENYAATYKSIKGCNAVLDDIDNAIGGIAEKEKVKAEALALRAYHYFFLVNFYGKPYSVDKASPGVPLKLTAAVREKGVARNSVEEVYKQIIKDLETASSLLEKYPKTRGDFRINHPAVNIMLSRAYLFMERWKEAVKAADKAIKSGGALTDYTRIPKGTRFDLSDYAHSGVEWIYGAPNTHEGMAYMLPSTGLMSKFTKKDRRLDLYFGRRNSENSGPITVVKQRDDDLSPGNAMRISEAYLNRAEALLQDNRAAEALNDLNTLRRHRMENYQDVNIADKKKLLEEIHLERRKEFCFEEHRWFDLRRSGMPSISHRFRSKTKDPWKTYTLNEKDPLYTLPIPDESIKQNTLLEQNESRKAPVRQGK